MDIEALFSGLAMLLTPTNMLYMALGVIMGEVLGFLPGLTGNIGIALMIPFTMKMPPLTAMTFLLSIYTGAIFGGSVTAITIGTPGAPSAIMTMMDGYPMRERGEAERAMGISLGSSFIGGFVGCICLIFAAEILAQFALKFGPAEMFMITLFGVSIVGSLAKSYTKALFSGCIGLLLGTVGMNSMGTMRGTMGIAYLLDGIPRIPMMMGLVALPAVFNLCRKESFVKNGEYAKKSNKAFAKLVKGFIEPLKHLPFVVFNAILGVIVGIMPAAGTSVAATLSYNLAKQWSNEPEKFGTGEPKGLMSCETANNAAEGGALAMMFALAIPGSGGTSLILGALSMQGWAIGPKMMVNYRDVIYACFSSMFFQQFLMVLVGFGLCMLGSKIIKTPIKILVPCIVLMSIVASYANRYTLFDTGLMLVFGLLGWYMRKFDFPVLPMILGHILGGMADQELLRVRQSFDTVGEVLSRPIVIGMIVLCLITAIVPRLKAVKKKRNKS